MYIEPFLERGGHFYHVKNGRYNSLHICVLQLLMEEEEEELFD